MRPRGRAKTNPERKRSILSRPSDMPWGSGRELGFGHEIKKSLAAAATEGFPRCRKKAVNKRRTLTPHRLPTLTPHAMNNPARVQGIRRCWPGSTFGADRGSKGAPNNIYPKLRCIGVTGACRRAGAARLNAVFKSSEVLLHLRQLGDRNERGENMTMPCMRRIIEAPNFRDHDIRVGPGINIPDMRERFRPPIFTCFLVRGHLRMGRCSPEPGCVRPRPSFGE